MSETSQLTLPLLAPSQAQKHVTVNEAFARLDGLTQMVLASRSTALPPVSALDGTSYAVPGGAVNGWSGQDGKVAVFANGGWVFAAPKRGWRGFVADESAVVVYDGTDWLEGGLAISSSGAATLMKIEEFDHAIAAGTSSTPAQPITDGAMVLAVTARVLTTITGTLSSWKLGNVGAEDRFGSGLGVAAGSYARGMLSQPQSFYGATPLVLTAQGGSFAGGLVRIAVHYIDLAVPGM